MATLLTFFLAAAAGSSGVDVGKQLVAAMKSGDGARIRALLAEVGAEPTKTTVEIVLRIGVEHPSHEVYAAVRQTLAAVRGAEAIAAIGKTLAQQKDERMRTLALFALEDIPVEAAVSHLEARLKVSEYGERVAELFFRLESAARRAGASLSRRSHRDARAFPAGVSPPRDCTQGLPQQAPGRQFAVVERRIGAYLSSDRALHVHARGSAAHRTG